MKTTAYLCVLGISAALMGACGDDDGGDADAGISFIDASNETPVDAPPAPPACDEFAAPATTLSTYPATYSGDTGGAGADLEVASGVCTDERSYYGQPGDDQVVALTGLTAASEYAIKITSAADISFYLATDCSDEAGGPAAGDCLLFVDESGGSEFGDFTAPASGAVMLVIDNYSGTPATDATYVLEVYEPECSDDDGCSVPTPFCFERICVACVTSFDCADPALPICSDNVCSAGYDGCVDDDSAENGDDGPAGATVLSPSADTPDSVIASICSSPAGEVDYFKFTVADGETRAIEVDWVGGDDIDLVLQDSEGAVLGTSYYEQPEAVRLNELDAGTYYAIVYLYAPANSTAVVDYTITGLVPECDTSFDCAESVAPVCSAAGLCEAGPGDCTGDDEGLEDDDDGPAGATAITYTYDTTTQVTGHICSTPAAERDFYKVDVAAGDDLDVAVAWTDGVADLDLYVYDAAGKVLGFTYWLNPEGVTLSNLPAGSVYISVQYFGAAVLPAVAYTVDVLVSAGGCVSDSDCATVFETQLLRGDCDASGACLFIDGAEALANGVTCDTPDDCLSGMCSYVLFQSDGAKSVCTVGCATDAECVSALGTGYACTIPFSTNFCHPACTTDTDCGANVGSETPDTDLAWDYLVCNVGTGVCDL